MEKHENYFVWLINQLKGWPVQNYMLWFFAFGFQLALWGVTFAQGDATLAMAVNSLIYVVNDVLAFTISPWFNAGRKKSGLKVIK